MKRSRLRPVSKKRAAQLRQYTPLRREFLAANPRCEFPAGCTQEATDVHHKAGRVGAALLDVTHWAALCRAHHSWITEHPDAAKAMGMSERRLGGAA